MTGCFVLIKLRTLLFLEFLILLVCLYNGDDGGEVECWNAVDPEMNKQWRVSDVMITRRMTSMASTLLLSTLASLVLTVRVFILVVIIIIIHVLDRPAAK